LIHSVWRDGTEELGPPEMIPTNGNTSRTTLDLRKSGRTMFNGFQRTKRSLRQETAPDS
jgi:hypothetical protein